MPSLNITFDRSRLRQLCQHWEISELALFGSVLRDELRPESDVDLLVSFAPSARTSYWDWPELTRDLQGVFGREIDLVVKDGLKNPFRKHEILSTAQVIYAA